MRREIASQKSQVQKAAAPAARAFLEAQAKAEVAEEAEVDALVPATYAWEEPQRALDMADFDEGATTGAYPMAPEPLGGYGGGGPPGAPSPPPLAQAAFAGALGPSPAPAPALERTRAAAPPRKAKKMSIGSYEKTSEELQLEATGAKVVETGFWLWRNVIVPPNVYVVHTRRGRAEPVTIGLGKSFRYNPLTDSYLVVPAAMQTIGIFARSISAEKQGVNVLAYVQWLISDFALAYKRLDFSNIHDPMGIVNAQLKEQAEAAIKDTVATMSVEQVLKDKAPIIQELTERMKSVAEGRDGDGLGLKIVTVQIKEAMVASTSLWENLQAPFRHDKARIAKLSEIETEAEIHGKSREAALEREQADARAASEIAKLRAQVELENRAAALASQVRQQEIAQKAEQDEQRYRQETQVQRIALEQTLAREQAKTELQRLAAEHARAAEEARLATENEAAAIAQQETLAIARSAAELAELEAAQRLTAARREAELVEMRARLSLDQERFEARLTAERTTETQRVELLVAAQQAELARARQAAEIERHQQETANMKSPGAIQGELVKVLPAIAQAMPDIQEYRYVGVSDGKDGGASPFSALPEFLAKALGVANAFGFKPLGSGGEAAAPREDV